MKGMRVVLRSDVEDILHSKGFVIITIVIVVVTVVLVIFLIRRRQAPSLNIKYPQ